MTSSTMFEQRPFIFVRHGESTGNARNICQGTLDFPLTERGRSSAANVAEVVRPYSDRLTIFSSTLERARQTTEILLPGLNFPPCEWRETLRERCWGELQGGERSKMIEQEMREAAACYHDPTIIKGLESLADFDNRVRHEFSTILGRSEVDIPLIVSHGRVFRAVCSLLHATTELPLPNAAPVWCEPEKGGWKIRKMTPATPPSERATVGASRGSITLVE